MQTVRRAVRQIELDQVAEACRALRLDADEAESVLASHRAGPWLLGLYVSLGGTAVDFVVARVEIRRTLRAPG